MTSYRIAQAARLLGVSDDTVRRWIDSGMLPASGSPTEIPGTALAERAVALAAESDDPTAAVRSSARNRFPGIVTRVQVDGVMAQVDVQCGPHRVVSLMSAEAVRELGLAVGALAVASVKATNVVIETPRD